MIYGFNELFSLRTTDENFKNRTKDDYKSRESFCIINTDFRDLKKHFSDCKKVDTSMYRRGNRDLYYDIDEGYPYLSKDQMVYMNLLSELFEDSIKINYTEWYYNSLYDRNNSFENYINITGDDIIKRREIYVQKIKTFIDEFSNFYLIIEKLEEKYKEYLSNF